MARRSTAGPSDIPAVPWSDFMASWFDWRQGEHVSIIGPTGTGKSWLGRHLLERRRYVVALGNKRKDDTLSRYLTEDGFTRIHDWPPTRPWLQKLPAGWDERVLLWPPWRGGTNAMREKYAELFGRVLDDALASGGWCVDVDEAFYLTKILGLGPQLEEIWTQGRSSKVSLLAKTQRPAWVPLFMFDQATHLFLFRDNDERNLSRLGGLGGLSAALVSDTVAALPHRSLLYLNTRTHAMCVTRVE